MADLMISQTEPVSSLPRDYSRFLRRVKDKNEPIVFLKRNRPVGALVGWNWLKQILELKITDPSSSKNARKYILRYSLFFSIIDILKFRISKYMSFEE